MQASGDKISLAEVRKALQGPNGRNAQSITFSDFEEIMSQQQQSAGMEEDAADPSSTHAYPLGTQLQAPHPFQASQLSSPPYSLAAGGGGEDSLTISFMLLHLASTCSHPGDGVVAVGVRS